MKQKIRWFTSWNDKSLQKLPPLFDDIGVELDKTCWYTIKVLIYEIVFNAKEHGKAQKCFVQITKNSIAVFDDRIKYTRFSLHLSKSFPVKFQQKRQQRSASGQGERPGSRTLRGVHAVSHEKCIRIKRTKMQKTSKNTKLRKTLKITLKRGIILVRTSRFWYDNGML